MRKIIMTLLLCCTFAFQGSAQEVFTEIKGLMDGYLKVKNDTTLNLEVRKIATFKWDAIYYMVYKCTDETESELGTQVSAMVDFVNLYLARLNKAKKASDKQLVRAQFKNATIEHAKFNDPDKDIIYAYVDNQDFLTQFSLDTDWVKALDAVK